MEPPKTISLLDVAEAAGVSRIAAAKVLNGAGGRTTRVGKETAARIHAVAKQMNYRPNLIAQQLAGKKSNIIGIILDSKAPVVHMELVAHMERYAAKYGYRFMIGQTHGDLALLKEYAEDFNSRCVDGIICVSHDYPQIASEIIDIFSKSNNVVFIGKPGCDEVGINIVRCDITEAGKQLVNHLFKRGYDKIAILLYKSGSKAMAERLYGYQAAFRERQKNIHEDFIRYIPVRENLSEVLLQDEVQYLIKEKKIQAIMAPDDIVAAMLVVAINALGYKVPDDVAITGFDNSIISQICNPPLTTIDAQKDILSKLTIGLLLKIINGEDIVSENRHIVVSPKLVARRST